MKTKSLFAVLIICIFTLTILVPSAHAGNVQRNRWEGIAIGLGTAIIGSALLKNHQYQPAPSRYYAPAPDCDPAPYTHGYSKRDHSYGHWEIRKEWVPPSYKKVWNPGHYTRRGEWISGYWMKIEDEPGYWSKTRVWVSHR